MEKRRSILDLLEELRSIAQLGLNFSNGPYDLLRYQCLMEIASMQYSVLTGLDKDEIRNRFSSELGYITPKLGVQGILINEEGLLLLEKRKDDQLWGLPGGWAEVGETPEETIIREFKEETNLNVQPIELLGLYTRLPGQYNQPHTSVHILYYCNLVNGELKISHESLEMKYCEPQMISCWHKDHEQQALKGWEYWTSIKKIEY